MKNKLKNDKNNKKRDEKILKKKKSTKGFTLVELLATIAIIAVISAIAIVAVVSVINTTKEKNEQIAISNVKATANTISKEIDNGYWVEYTVDNATNMEATCISVQDMIHLGYFKGKEFKNLNKVKTSSFVRVLRDTTNDTIISETIENDSDGYCSNSYSPASLKVISFSGTSVSVEVSNCDNATGYIYSYKTKKASNYSNSVVESASTYTYNGLTRGTNYDFNVECKFDNTISRRGNLDDIKTVEKIKVNNQEIDCSVPSNTIELNYDKRATSITSDSINNNNLSCEKGQCSITTGETDKNVNVIVSGQDYNANFSDKQEIEDLKNIESLNPLKPTIKASDNINSGVIHADSNGFKLTISGGNNNDDSSECSSISYEYSTDNSNFTRLDGSTINISTSDDGKTYYVRSINASNKVGEVAEYKIIFGTTLKATFVKGTGISSIGYSNKTCVSTGSGCEIKLPSITPNSGYVADGWYNGDVKVGEQNTNYKITSDITLTAKGENSIISVAIPTSSGYCKSGLIYNGSTQTLTNEPSEGYTFSNNKRVEAGSQSVTATLTEGYIWSDNTSTTKTFSCSISKATPTITLSSTSGTVVSGSTISFTEKADVSGTFKNVSNSTSIATISSGATFSNVTANTAKTVKIKGVALGSTSVTITFTPTDTTNYNSVTKTYSVIGAKTKTINTGEVYSSTYSGTVTISDATRILSATVNNGNVQYSFSNKKFSYTVKNGTSKSSSYSTTCTISPTTSAATISSSTSCSCPKGGVLYNGTKCSKYVSKSGTGTVKYSLCCDSSGKRYDCGSSGSYEVVCASGETKSYSCNSPTGVGASCTVGSSAIFENQSCTGQCIAPAYNATCTTSNTYSCETGVLSGSYCYYCGYGYTYNSSTKTCYKSCTESYTYYSYTITVTYTG